uniref:Holocytochrome c-type synthase n=1 Tax=Babesia bovis TaxID=5865 RepID=A7ARS4_BABBO|eukprot:XP_001610811.1 cytochrome c/c1 heme lyase [Babesia bovis T2Bo]
MAKMGTAGQILPPSCPVESQYSDEKLRTKSNCGSAQTEASTIPIISASDLKVLSSTRIQSNIPGKEYNWIYPSERQFFRSSLAKGHQVEAKVIPTVVKIHNAINEKAWERIIEYEDLHAEHCEKPVLAHFIGKKDELSMRARLKHFMGYKLPYIIDFYEGKAPNNEPVAVYMDVRPALTLEGIIDRARLWFKKKWN